jgi:hypothetical protein|nr:MAG TPA: endonuclease [Caudoviricetes sp.]
MMLNQEYIKKILHYSPSSGLFYWNKPGRKIDGKIAGSRKRNGYLQIEIERRKFYLHRLAWLYVYGDMPHVEVDHINGVRDDNRICNLRLASRSQNGMNTIKPATNTSGIKGVSWDKRNNKWCAQIKINQKTVWLGRHTSIESASMAIERARMKLHGDFACNGVRQEKQD